MAHHDFKIKKMLYRILVYVDKYLSMNGVQGDEILDSIRH